jgi:hypothetical protein
MAGAIYTEALNAGSMATSLGTAPLTAAHSRYSGTGFVSLRRYGVSVSDSRNCWRLGVALLSKWTPGRVPMAAIAVLGWPCPWAFW